MLSFMCEGRGQVQTGAVACPATGMSDKDALGLGTLGFQEPVARKMAAAAGFTRFEVIDWQVCHTVTSPRYCFVHSMILFAGGPPLSNDGLCTCSTSSTTSSSSCREEHAALPWSTGGSFRLAPKQRKRQEDNKDVPETATT